MSTAMDTAIQALHDELETVNKRAAEIMKHINDLSIMAGLTAPFPNIEISSTMGATNIQPDQFFGKSLSSAVRQYLRMKGRAATAKEIYQALKSGGFEFEWDEKDQLRNVAITLSKNRYDFCPVPVGDEKAFGLWDFYPEKKREREKQLKENTLQEDQQNQPGEKTASSGSGILTTILKKRGRPRKEGPKETLHPALGEPIEDDPEYKNKKQ